MASPKTLEQVRAARQKRQGVFEKARAMRQAGQISETDFALLEKKFQQKMQALDAAEAEILATQGEPEPSPDDSSAEEVLGLAKEILGSAGPEHAAAQQPEWESVAAHEPEPEPEFEAVAEPEVDPDLEATLPDLSRLGEGADEDDGSADATDPEGHAPLTGPLVPPEVAVQELSAMLRGVGVDQNMAPPSLTSPAVDAGAGGDSDLLSLVRGSFSSDQDSTPDTESRLRAEQRAREEAVARAKAREEEAAEMHVAFRRAVKEKDSLGAKLVAARRESDRLRKGAFGGLAALVVVMGLAVILNQARQAAVKEADESRAKASGFETERAKLVTRAERAEADAAKIQGEKERLAGQVRGSLRTLKTKLDASEARVAELEEQLAGVPAEGGGALVPDARMDGVLLKLLHLRVRRSGPDEEGFLEGVAEEVPAARAALAELARRRQVDGGMLDDPLVDALELALAGNLRAASVPMEVLLEREQAEAAGTRRALAAVRLELGDGAGAAALLEGISGDSEDAVEAQRLLAAAYRRARRFDDARRVLQRILASPRATHDDFLQAGMVAEMTEDAAAAEAAYRHVVERDPENARAISLLSSLAIQRADWSTAEALLERALGAKPEDDALRYNLALARLGLGEDEAATPLVEELLRRGWPGSEELAEKLGLDPAAYAPAPPAPEDPAPEVPDGHPLGDGGDELPGSDGELPGDGGDELPGASGDLPGAGGDLPGDGNGEDLPGLGG